ncbi:MAG: helix-turn-helix domain-containing protein, partial [Acidimicrobiales bacterium]
MDRLETFQALADRTRYSIFVELARSGAAMSTAEVAERLGLPANTARPHLERLREAGLLEVRRESRGTVGRPLHRYLLAAGQPGPGPEPPAHLMLARLLAELVSPRLTRHARVPQVGDASQAGRIKEAGPTPEMTAPEMTAPEMTEQLVEVGRARGRRRAAELAASSCLEALLEEQSGLGFEPVLADEDRSRGGSWVRFSRCPFLELATDHP